MPAPIEVGWDWGFLVVGMGTSRGGTAITTSTPDLSTVPVPGITQSQTGNHSGRSPIVRLFVCQLCAGRNDVPLLNRSTEIGLGRGGEVLDCRATKRGYISYQKRNECLSRHRGGILAITTTSTLRYPMMTISTRQDVYFACMHRFREQCSVNISAAPAAACEPVL